LKKFTPGRRTLQQRCDFAFVTDRKSRF